MESFKKAFFNRNVFAASFGAALAMFFQNVWRPYWSLYLQEPPISLSILQIGLLTMIDRSEHLLFQLPGGILADRIGRKKTTLMGAVARIAAPLIYLFAGSFELVVLGTFFVALSSVANPGFQALIAESLPRDQMGAGYGVFVMIRRLPILFAPLIGGILMDALGMQEGMRICFIGGVICSIISLVIRYFFITETLVRKHEQRSNTITKDFKEILPLFKGILGRMQVTSCLIQFSGGLTQALIVIYVHDIIGLTNIEWGFIITIVNVIGFLTSVPGGMLADKFNRVRLISFAEAISILPHIGYVTLRNFYHILAIRMTSGIGMGLSGAQTMGVMGGPAWYSMLADIVPMEMRGRVNGLMATISGIVALPAPYIGAYMWEEKSIGPDVTLLTNVALGVGISILFLGTVKDPKRDETVTAQGGDAGI